MSTYVLMRILESAPHRYDRGMRLLTLGRIDRAYDAIAEYIEPNSRVLDIGCGTGALTARAARRGALVTAMDVNPEMLAIARRKIKQQGLEHRVTFDERGVAELDGQDRDSYDTVTSGLCLSELSPDELRWTLEQVRRVLIPGGLFLVADETRPPKVVARIVHWLLKAPLAVATYVFTQQTTHALRELPDRLSDAGLALSSVTSNMLGSFSTYAVRKPGDEPT